MDSLRGSIKSADDFINSLTIAGNHLQEKINNIENKIKSEVLPYRSVLKKVEDEYSRDRNIQDLKRFGLSLLFIVPVFLFLWRRYFRF